MFFMDLFTSIGELPLLSVSSLTTLAPVVSEDTDNNRSEDTENNRN